MPLFPASTLNTGGGGPAYIGAMRQRRITPAARTATSANPAFPVTNLDDYLRPIRRWEATTTEAQRITYDLGVANQPIGAIFLGWIGLQELTHFYIQANGSDVWTNPAFTQLVAAPDCRNPVTRRNAYAIVPDPGTLFCRYVSAYFPAHDSLLPVSLGQFEVLNPDGLLLPQRAPLRWGAEQGELGIDHPTLTRSRVVVGPKLLTVNFDWEYAYHYLNEGSLETEDGLIEDENIHAEVDDHFLIIRDVRYLANFSMIAQLVSTTMSFESALGIGANLPLGYREICY